jgi:hypothetical protein
MKIPVWTKPAIWGAVGGALFTALFGFNYLGWSSAGNAKRMAEAHADTAIVAAMVPFCVAKAKEDADPARLEKLRAETSSYTRSEQVRAAGWATLPGMTSADGNLARACSERLLTVTAGG